MVSIKYLEILAGFILIFGEPVVIRTLMRQGGRAPHTTVQTEQQLSPHLRL